jgi:hypothetical protein
MAPRPVFPLPAVAFEVAVIGAAVTTAPQKKRPLWYTPQLAPARLDRAARSVL